LAIIKIINTDHNYGLKYSNYDVNKNIMEIKGKAIPVQAWTGPEGSRRLRPPDFKTIGT